MQTVSTTHSAGPAGSHTSHLDLTAGYKISHKTGFLYYNYFLTGEEDKAFFSIPSETVTKRNRQSCWPESSPQSYKGDREGQAFQSTASIRSLLIGRHGGDRHS
jgi:hypothetical protein